MTRGKRSLEAGPGPRVDQDTPCKICQRTEPLPGRAPQISCDCCLACFCIGCLGLETVPLGSWYCSECRPYYVGRAQQAVDVRAAGQSVTLTQRPEARPTYDVARPPRYDKSQRRRAAGLGSAGLPTREEVARLKEAAVAESTRSRIEQAKQRLIEMTTDLGIDPKAEGVYELFVTWRVKNGFAEQTILTEMSLLKHVDGVKIPPEKELKTLTQAVTRLAECPGNAKDPITPAEMLIVREQMMRDWRDDRTERHRRQLRNWCYCLLAFVGLFRPGELVDLEWTSVKLGWKTGPGNHTVELDFGAQPGAKIELAHAHFYIIKSKTDRAAKGQHVKIAAGQHHGLLDCPIQLLLKMYAHKRGNYVFEELRERYPPAKLTDDTFRNALDNALREGGITEARRARLSLHSFRRGGATAAAACGASIREIKALGRWRSDVAYIYALISDQQAMRVTADLLNHLRELAIDE